MGGESYTQGAVDNCLCLWTTTGRSKTLWTTQQLSTGSVWKKPVPVDKNLTNP